MSSTAPADPLSQLIGTHALPSGDLPDGLGVLGRGRVDRSVPDGESALHDVPVTLCAVTNWRGHADVMRVVWFTGSERA